MPVVPAAVNMFRIKKSGYKTAGFFLKQNFQGQRK